MCVSTVQGDVKEVDPGADGSLGRVDKHLTAKMGLFEEIERAWFTVDNKLFLWDYNDG